MRARLLVVLILVVGTLAVGSRPAEAQARHALAGVSRSGNGARIRMRLSPAGSYSRVTFGVFAGVGNRYSALTHRFAPLTLAGPTEQAFDLPYDGRTFRSGVTVTLITQWPTAGRTHYWGGDRLTLP